MERELTIETTNTFRRVVLATGCNRDGATELGKVQPAEVALSQDMLVHNQPCDLLYALPSLPLLLPTLHRIQQ